MADCDVALIDAAGLSASRVADLLDKSRQAVSKGLKSKRPYFREDEVLAIYDEAVAAKPHARHGLQELIRLKFSDLADRLIDGDAEEGLVKAVAESHRVWVIAANYLQSRSLSEKRVSWLVRHLISSGLEEIVVLCENELEAEMVRREFPTAMFDRDQVAVFTCEILANLQFMLITFGPSTTKSFILAERGFAALPDYETHRLVKTVHSELALRRDLARASEA